MILWIDTDNLLSLTDLRDQDGNAVEGASVNATLYEPDRSTEVGGQTWPLALSDDGGGNYSGVIEDTVNIEVGKVYWILVEIDGGGAQDTRWGKARALRRDFED